MPEFDQHATTYAASVNDAIAFSGLKVDTFVRAKLVHLRRIFAAQAIAADDRIVDIGCGVGTYEMDLAQDWNNIVGIDVSTESLAQARLTCEGAHFKDFDGKTMPFESNSVAAAFAICVWHHVPVADWELFVAEIHRVLKPGGIVAVFEHNPWNPLTRWAVERCVFDKDAVLLSMPNARDRLKAGGLTILDTDYILSIPVTEGFAGKLDRMLAPVPTGAQYMVVARKAAG